MAEIFNFLSFERRRKNKNKNLRKLESFQWRYFVDIIGAWNFKVSFFLMSTFIVELHLDDVPEVLLGVAVKCLFQIIEIDKYVLKIE